MKRRVVTILVFLALGAIVNVGVAWGCALFVGVGWGAEEDGVGGFVDHCDRTWIAWIGSQVGTAVVSRIAAEGTFGATAIAPDEIPAWSGLRHPPAPEARDRLRLDIARGWQSGRMRAWSGVAESSRGHGGRSRLAVPCHDVPLQAGLGRRTWAWRRSCRSRPRHCHR